MFKSIYKKIREDFAFLSDYGYHVKYEIDSSVHPAVTFTNGSAKIQIGYAHDDGQMFLYRYAPIDTIYPDNILRGTYLEGKSYKDQVEQAKEILRKFLDNQIR